MAAEQSTILDDLAALAESLRVAGDERHERMAVAALERSREEVETLREFARWVIAQAWEGGDICGGDVQDKAAEIGLLEEVEVDAPCSENCACAEFGFPTNCFLVSSILSAKPGEVGR